MNNWKSSLHKYSTAVLLHYSNAIPPCPPKVTHLTCNFWRNWLYTVGAPKSHWAVTNWQALFPIQLISSNQWVQGKPLLECDDFQLIILIKNWWTACNGANWSSKYWSLYLWTAVDCYFRHAKTRSDQQLVPSSTHDSAPLLLSQHPTPFQPHTSHPAKAQCCNTMPRTCHCDSVTIYFNYTRCSTTRVHIE